MSCVITTTHRPPASHSFFVLNCSYEPSLTAVRVVELEVDSRDISALLSLASQPRNLGTRLYILTLTDQGPDSRFGLIDERLE